MLNVSAAPRCKHCGAELFTIPGQIANIGWVCGCCDDKTSTKCTHRPRPDAAPRDSTEGTPRTAEPASVAAPAAASPFVDTPVRTGTKIPEGLPQNPFTLRVWAAASGISARYFGCPVYLVGGALRDPDPRDIDLIVALPDNLFAHSYGEHPWSVDGVRSELDAWECSKSDPNPAPVWRRWARDCAKQSRLLTLATGRAVDFKTQPLRAFEAYAFKPRLRLDCAFMPDTEAT